MQIRFPYADVPPLEVPDGNFLGFHHPKREPDAPPPDELVRQALSNPIGAARLADSVRSGQKVLIVVDDLTRPTPQNLLLPAVIEELHQCGVPDADIRILIAYGSHRPMTPLEKHRKLGSHIVNRYEVLDHDWEGKDQLVDLGPLEDGTPVIVNRHVVESDFVLSVGHIVPHRAQGFTGGSKIILPGVAGRPSLNHMHWTEAQFDGPQILGQVDNPVREMSTAFATKAGLKFVVNVVLDDEERVVGAFAGDMVQAYRKGCERALEVYGIPIQEPADICIIDSYPADVDLWQANKAIFAAEPAVKQGGVVVLVTPAPEGAAKAHPKLVNIGFQPHDRVMQMVQEGQLEAGASAAALSDVGRVIKEKARGIIVSSGIHPALQEKLGFLSAETPQEALELAFGMTSRKATVIAFHHGGEILPLVGRK